MPGVEFFVRGLCGFLAYMSRGNPSWGSSTIPCPPHKAVCPQGKELPALRWARLTRSLPDKSANCIAGRGQIVDLSISGQPSTGRSILRPWATHSLIRRGNQPSRGVALIAGGLSTNALTSRGVGGSSIASSPGFLCRLGCSRPLVLSP